MASVNDYGGAGQTLAAPPLGGPAGWAAAVAAALDGDDTTVDTRVAAAGAAFLPKAGGTMTGGLTLNGDPTGALLAATKQYVDAAAAASTGASVPKSTVGNLLTANQAAPADGTGWVINGATAAYSGGYMTATATATASASTTPRVPVTAGQTYTVQVHYSSTTVAVSARMVFYNALTGGATVGSTVVGNVVAAGASGVSTATGIAPAGATHAIAYVIQSIATGAVVTVGRIGLWAGAGGEWAMPGTVIVDQGVQTTHPLTDDVLTRAWDAGKGRWQTTHYDSGWREVTTWTTGGAVTGLPLGANWVPQAGVAGHIRVRRHEQTLHVMILGLQVTSSTPGTLVTLPAGFRPVAIASTAAFPASVSQAWALTLDASGNITRAGNSAVTANSYVANFGMGVYDLGNAALPTTLPGTLVSAAPA